MDSRRPIIALLGSVDHEGIVSVVKTSGYVYEKKLLESSKDNWRSIVRVVEKSDVHAVLAKLSQPVYECLNNPDYERVSEDLLAAITKKPSLVFIYEGLWAPFDEEEATDEEDREQKCMDAITESRFRRAYSRYEPLDSLVRASVNEKLRTAGIEPVCYSTNAQLTIIGAQFLKDLAARLLFRVYIPEGRLYATEIDKLLQLFKEFLDSTGRGGITLNKVAADQGSSFEFCGDYSPTSSLAEDFQDFSQFMELCVSDLEKARTMLALRDVDQVSATKIISRYAKEARRLFLDIAHERETKILGIRHLLESELSDSLPPSTSSQIIRALVDESIPEATTLAGLVTGSGINTPPQQVTININPQIIGNLQGIVAREVSGNVNLGQDAEQLMQIIATYGKDRVRELSSDVHEVGDRGRPEGTRLTKTQRIKSFLYGLGPEIAKTGLHLLEEYVKTKMQ